MAGPEGETSPAMLGLFIVLRSLAVRAICRSRDDLVIENLALRQQVAVLERERPQPAFDDTDRTLWVALHAAWPRWVGHLVIVQADTGQSDTGSDSAAIGRGCPSSRPVLGGLVSTSRSAA